MPEPLRIITKPSVFVLARQGINTDDWLAALDHIGAHGWHTDAPSDAESIVEFSGRLCYDSFKNPRPGGNAAYIGHILESGHGSVLEHAVWKILITGISRSLSHELVRHRVGLSVSQLSQRFVDESDCAFVVPPALIPALDAHRASERARQLVQNDLDEMPEWDHGEAYRLWERQVFWAARNYAELAGLLAAGAAMAPHPSGTAKRKAAREAARSVLPNAAETRIVLTGNARAWRHLIELRGSVHADAEFRRLVLMLLSTFKAESPHLFADMREEKGAVVVEHHKV